MIKTNIDIIQSKDEELVPLCIHKEHEIVQMPNGSHHKFKEVCKDCQAFICWRYTKNISTPIVLERKKIIKKIMPHSTKWEKRFFSSLLKIDTLSEKQEQVWKRILADYQDIKVLEKD